MLALKTGGGSHTSWNVEVDYRNGFSPGASRKKEKKRKEKKRKEKKRKEKKRKERKRKKKV